MTLAAILAALLVGWVLGFGSAGGFIRERGYRLSKVARPSVLVGEARPDPNVEDWT